MQDDDSWILMLPESGLMYPSDKRNFERSTKGDGEDITDNIKLKQQGFKKFHFEKTVLALQLSAEELDKYFPQKRYQSLTGDWVTNMDPGDWIVVPTPWNDEVYWIPAEAMDSMYQKVTPVLK